MSSWAHPPRPPIGQYRLTLTWTGDDPGPDPLVWLVEHQLSHRGAIVRVTGLERIDGDADE